MNKAKEKNLENHENSCRLCLTSFLWNEIPDKLTDAIRKTFFDLTATHLDSSDKYSSFICRRCKDDLTGFLRLRKKLIEDQKELENFVNEREEKPVNLDQLIKAEPVECSVIKSEIFDDDEEFPESFVKTELQEEEEQEEENYYGGDLPFSPVPQNEPQEPPKKDLPCQWCHRKYVDQNSLENHHLYKHKDKLSATEIRDIRKKKKSGRTLVCPQCGISTHNLKEHTQIYHLKIKRFFCDNCNYKSYGRREMEQHMRKHRKTKDFQCDLCGVFFSRKNAIYTHFNNVHRSEGRLTCCFCKKKCKNKMALWNHRKTHPIEELNKKEQCTICKKEILITYMSKHLRLIHETNKNDNEMQLCLICGKMYKKKTFWFHQRWHSERKHPCKFPSCTKAYFTANQLLQHEKVHRNQREHKCEVPGCEKSYYKDRLLRMHISLNHENFKEKCPIPNCNFAVGRKDYMRTHLSKHTELGEEMIASLILDVKKNPKLW